MSVAPGRILKAAGRVVPAEIVDARGQAAALLAEAEAERARARDEADDLRAVARREGYEAGLHEGRERALAEATEILVAARAEAERARREARDAAVVLARKMAERIVGAAVELEPARLAAIVDAALAASRARSGRVVVRVHPADLPTIEQERAALRRRLPDAQVELIADEAVGRCGCVVETPIGKLDARLDVQLGALERALQASLAQRRGG